MQQRLSGPTFVVCLICRVVLCRTRSGSPTVPAMMYSQAVYSASFCVTFCKRQPLQKVLTHCYTQFGNNLEVRTITTILHNKYNVAFISFAPMFSDYVSHCA